MTFLSHLKPICYDTPFQGRPIWASVEFTPGGKRYHYWVDERWGVVEGNTLQVTTPYGTKQVEVVAYGVERPPTYHGAMRAADRVVSYRRKKQVEQPKTPEPEINVGDWVLVRQHSNPEQFNQTDGFCNFWCEEMDGYMGRPFKVHHIAPSGVTLEDAGCYRFPPQMLEPLKVAQRDPVEVGNEIHTRLADMDFAELEQRVMAQMLESIGVDFANQKRRSMEQMLETLDRVLPHLGKPDCFPYFFTHSPDRYTKPNPEETPVSIKIETITYVNGIPVHDLSDDAVFEIISRAEKEITRLEGISARPARIDKRIAELRAGIDELVKLLDERDKKDEEAKAD